jgi:hypothetical protein
MPAPSVVGAGPAGGPAKNGQVSAQWAALAPRWDEVEASHLAEVGLGWTKARCAPKTSALMQSILWPEQAVGGSA